MEDNGLCDDVAFAETRMDSKKKKKVTALEGVVPKDIARRFRAACRANSLNQKETLGRLAELFTRLPEPVQGTLGIALRSDDAYQAFIEAVQLVIYDVISDQLGILDAARMVGRFRRLERLQQHTTRDTGSRSG